MSKRFLLDLCYKGNNFSSSGSISGPLVTHPPPLSVAECIQRTLMACRPRDVPRIQILIPTPAAVNALHNLALVYVNHKCLSDPKSCHLFLTHGLNERFNKQMQDIRILDCQTWGKSLPKLKPRFVCQVLLSKALYEQEMWLDAENVFYSTEYCVQIEHLQNSASKVREQYGDKVKIGISENQTSILSNRICTIEITTQDKETTNHFLLAKSILDCVFLARHTRIPIRYLTLYSI